MGCAQSVPKVQQPDSLSTSLTQEQLLGSSGQQQAGKADTAPVQDSDVQLQLTNGKSKLEDAEPALQQSRSILVTWRQPGKPLHEEDRWDSVCRMQILDTEPEEAYDSITRLCTQVFRCPISCVTFFDRDRVWFKSVIGFTSTQADRNCSICSWTALTRFPQALVVPDLKDDARFSKYPVANEPPYVRFYAGSPLVASNGVTVGTLCALDTKPREFSVDDTKLLAQLATLVMKEVKRREGVNDAVGRSIMEPEEEQHTMAASVAADSQAIMLCDVSDPKWPILFANSAWEVNTGMSRGLAFGANFWEVFLPLSARQVQAYTLATEQQRPFQLRVRCTPANSAAVPEMDSLHSPGACGPGACRTGSSSKRRTVQLQFWSMAAAGSTRGPLAAAAAIAIPATLNGKLAGGGDSGRYYWASVVPEEMDKVQSMEQRTAGSGGATAIDSNCSSSSGGYRTGSAGRGSGGRGSGSRVGSGGKVGSDGSGAAGVANGTPLGSASTEVPLDGGSSEARQGETSTSGNGAAAEYGLVGREISSLGTAFLLLPEPQDAFSGIQLGNLLGRGAYGAVFRGRWNDQVVAVKIVDVADSKQSTHAALEPLLHTKLSHPNIVKLYGISTREVELCSEHVTLNTWLTEEEEHTQQQQEVWMIMEFCNRGTLSDAIARGALCELGPNNTRVFGSINMRRLVTTLREIASAMAYLHGQNVLHGDLTGNNIMLITDKTQRKGFAAKVSDFGLSRLIGEDEQRIKTRTHGTITHMAPEVLMSGTHSRKADVYSFGMVMMEAYIGECPFQGMHYAQVVQHVTTGQALHIPEDAPPELRALMQAALSHNPDDRPSFSDIHQRLCNMEAAIRKEEASKPMQANRSMSPAVPNSPLQSAGPSAEFSPTMESESLACFNTIQGIVSDTAMLDAAAVAADPTETVVESF